MMRSDNWHKTPERRPPPSRVVLRCATCSRNWELPIGLPDGPIDHQSLGEIGDRFHAAHKARYGFARTDKPVELVTLLVEAAVPAPPVAYGEHASGHETASQARATTRLVTVDPSKPATKVLAYQREHLRPGDRLRGPFVATEQTSTVYVQPGWEAVVDLAGNLVARAE